MSKLVDIFKEALPLLLQKNPMLLLLPLILIFTLAVCKWLNHSPHALKNRPPSPPKLPVIGNLHQLGSIPQRSLKSLAEKYGPVMILQLGSKPVLVISSARAAEQVLRTHDLAFASRPKPRFAGKLLYNYRNIAFAPYGEYWRQIRSICVLQLLSNKRVQSFKTVREEEVGVMMEAIQESCLSSSVIHISKIFATLTNDVVSRVAIGKRYSGEKGGSQFKELFEDLTMLVGSINVADFIPSLGWINILNGLEAKVKKVAEEFDIYLENIVEQGMKRGDDDEVEVQQNFVDVLLQVQRENATGFTLDRDSIKAIILDIFVAATDTTTSLLEWAMSELLRNTSAMTQLQNELRRFADCKSGTIKEDDLEKLGYLKAVIKETFRMHPPVPLLIPRESRMDVKLLGYDIAAGTQVMINAWAIGRDPRSWKDPDEFQPERFLNSPVDVKGQHFELIPFGSGRRSCPGSGFALASAELALANLMLKFNFALAGGGSPHDLDMSEAHSLVTPRKFPLLLVASPAE